MNHVIPLTAFHQFHFPLIGPAIPTRLLLLTSTDHLEPFSHFRVARLRFPRSPLTRTLCPVPLEAPRTPPRRPLEIKARR